MAKVEIDMMDPLDNSGDGDEEMLGMVDDSYATTNGLEKKMLQTGGEDNNLSYSNNFYREPSTNTVAYRLVVSPDEANGNSSLQTQTTYTSSAIGTNGQQQTMPTVLANSVNGQLYVIGNTDIFNSTTTKQNISRETHSKPTNCIKKFQSRSKQFKFVEVKKLLRLLEENREILCKKTDAVSNTSKERAWLKVTSKFNTSSSTHRDMNQLKLKWDNLKKAARKRAAYIARNNSKTRDEASSIEPDPILDWVISTTNISCVGEPKSYDSENGDDNTDFETVLVENPQLTESSEEVEDIKPDISKLMTHSSQSQETPTQEFLKTPKLEPQETQESLETSTPESVKIPMPLPQTPTPEFVKTPTSLSLKIPTPEKKKSRKNLMDELCQSKIARNNAIAAYYELKLKLLKAGKINLNNESDSK